MRTKWLNLDLFNLGVSFLLYYIVIFSIMPVVSSLGITTAYISEEERGVRFLTPDSLLYLIIGWICFALGYYLVPSSKINNSLGNFLKKDWDPARSQWVVLAVFIAGFVIKVPHFVSTVFQQDGDISEALYVSYFVSTVFQQDGDISEALSLFLSLNPLHFTALAIAFSQYFFLLRAKDVRSRAWCGIAWTLFIVEFLGQIIFGHGRMAILIPALIYLLTRHYLYKPNVGRILVVGLSLFLLIFPIKLYMKDKVSIDRSYFASEQGVSMIQALTSELPSTLSLITDSTVGRIGQSHVFTAIVEKTEYLLYGRGLLDFFRAFDLWSVMRGDIQFLNDGNDFGIAYGMIGIGDFFTGVGPTQIGDLYLNFGLLGIVFGMCLLGILYRYLFENLICAASISGVMIYSILWPQMIQGFEDFISLSYVKYLKVFFVLLGIHILLAFGLDPTFGKVHRRITRDNLKKIVKCFWTDSFRPVGIAIGILFILSTILSQSLLLAEEGAYSKLGKLVMVGKYQELTRDLVRCGEEDKNFFMLSLSREQFEQSVFHSHATHIAKENMYLRGLVNMEKGKYDDARMWFQKAGEAGHLQGMVNLGLIFEKGYYFPRDYQEAEKFYAQAEKHDYAPGLVGLANLYLEGKGVPKDPGYGSQLLSRAVKLGNPRAMARLGQLYEAGEVVDRDIDQARLLYAEAAKEGDNMAMFQLGRLYEKGNGVPVNLEKALTLYLNAASQENILAMKRLSVIYKEVWKKRDLFSSVQWGKRASQINPSDPWNDIKLQYFAELVKWSLEKAELGKVVAKRNLGIFYADGSHVPVSFALAKNWFDEAAASGDTASMRNLGFMYQWGLGVQVNALISKRWYGIAAEGSDGVAMRKLGQWYEGHGDGTKDMKMALHWYNKSAAAGNSAAMCRLAEIHFQDESVTQDRKVAEKWFRKAAEKGHVSAMNNLGLMLELGTGSERNAHKASIWYQRAVNEGNFSAMRNLGLLYEKGYGVQQDFDQALHLYRLASRGGDKLAMKKLSKL